MSRRRSLAALAALGALVGACAGSAPAPDAPPAPSAAPPAASSAAAPAVDRSRLPEPGPAHAWAPPAVELMRLKNGLPVYFQRRGSTPLVTLLLLIDRGTASEISKMAGLTALTADLLDEGAGGRTALQLSDELERHAIDYGARADVDSVMLYMDFVADRLPVAAGLLADIVLRPAFDATEFARRKEQRLAEALARESEPGAARSLALRRALFAEGYGGSATEGTRASLANLTLTAVKRQHDVLFRPARAALVVVGGVDVEAARAALEPAFGGWSGRSTLGLLSVGTSSGAKPSLNFIDFPGATQTVMTVARRAPGADDPAYFPAEIYSRAIGESFTSRINMKLREEKGYTYGARGAYTRWRRAGFFAVSANVHTEVTRAALDDTLAELSGPCGGRPLTEKERGEAISGLLLGFPGDFEQGAGVAMLTSTLHTLSRPLDWFQRWPERVAAVTLAEAQGAATAACDPQGWTVVLAGDRAKVEPTLRGLPWPVVLRDRQGEVAR